MTPPRQLDGREHPCHGAVAPDDHPEALTLPRPPAGPANDSAGRTHRRRHAARPIAGRQIAGTAKIVPIVHPGDDPPQPRYIPSTVLATFIRCRDMTCRFPGCDEPAHHCDIDHTIAYPTGPTQASNMKCLCRKHHLLKTFGGWHDQQWPDGTVDWTSPQGSPTPPLRQPTTVPAPYVDPPHPSSPTTNPAPRHPVAHWRCRGAHTPEPRTAPKPSTTNGGTTKPSSKPRQKNLRGTKVKIPEMLAANRISPLDRDPRAATTRHRSDGSDYRVPLISRRANTFQRR